MLSSPSLHDPAATDATLMAEGPSKSSSATDATLMATHHGPAASMDATLMAESPAPSAVATVAAPDAPPRHDPAALTLAVAAALPPVPDDGVGVGRITVLPRVVTQDSELRVEQHSRARYTVERSLGAGAMGEVELGEDHDIGRRVALKRLSAGLASPAAVARFVDEVRTMGALDHPNITPIYDVGKDERGRLFFTMKYVEGQSLESLIERLRKGDPQAHAQYPLARRLDVFVGIMNALDYAHAQGILHRDIKPANIMLGEHGEVRLMDWGIARRGGKSLSGGTVTQAERPDMTIDGSVLGTPLYMSPEQARGDQAAIDARSDLYSAFVVLFELLTLHRHVREEANVYATLQEVIAGRELGPHSPEWTHPAQQPVPHEIRYFLYRGLQRDPNARFQSAAEVIDMLERIRSGDIAVVCAITMFKATQQRLGKLADARPRTFMVMMAAAGMGLLGLLGLAGLGLASLV